MLIRLTSSQTTASLHSISRRGVVLSLRLPPSCEAGGLSTAKRFSRLFGTACLAVRRHGRCKVPTNSSRSMTPSFVAWPTISLRCGLSGIVFDGCRTGMTPNVMQFVRTLADWRDAIGGQRATRIDRHGWRFSDRSTMTSLPRRIATERFTSLVKITTHRSSGDRWRRFCVVIRTSALCLALMSIRPTRF